MGYRRPAKSDSLLVWQVAVDDSQRGRGLAGKMLDALFEQAIPAGVRYLDTTITPDNDASIRLFTSFAKRWDATLERFEFLAADEFPEPHEPEDLFRIGPLNASAD